MEGFHINRVGAIGPDPRQKKKDGGKKKKDQDKGEQHQKEKHEDSFDKSSTKPRQEEEAPQTKLSSNPTMEWLKLNNIRKNQNPKNN